MGQISVGRSWFPPEYYSSLYDWYCIYLFYSTYEVIRILKTGLSGNGAWTGDMLLVARSLAKKRSSPRAVARMAVITWCK